MASRPYSSLSSQNAFGLQSIIGGYDDPSVVPTSGGIGQLYIQVSSNPLNPQYGVFQKVITSGIDTNWERINNPYDMDIKDACQVASTVAGGDVALSGAFPLTIDGVVMNAAQSGYRILLKNQTLSQQNGIYVLNDAGSGTYLLTRAPDADSDSNVTQGMFTWVVLGIVNQEKGYMLITPNPIVLGVTPLNFVLTPNFIAVDTVFAEVHQLTAPQLAAKQVQLNNIPSNPAQVSIQIYGGVTQLQTIDFVMIGANLDVVDWNGALGMGALPLSVGDRIIVSYTY